MELIPAQITQLKKIVEDWSIHDKRELEATFRDASDATSFIAVAQRLKAKYKELPQEDYLNILTPKNYRFTIVGIDNIQKYCRSDSLDEIDYTIMKKDSVGPDGTLDIDEYGVRVKVRREDIRGTDDPDVREVLNGWATQRKAFRQIRRWSFLDEERGIRIDMSTIRSTGKMKRRLPTGKMIDDYRWQTRFSETDIRRQPIQYEIEVELLALTSEAKEDLPAARDQALKNLIRGIGEVLRGVQRNSVLIRKTMVRSILDEYKALTKKDRFRGVAPITLTTENMTKAAKAKVANIRSGYNVTDKADGTRMMGFVAESGELFLIDMSLNVYRTGLVRQACANSLIDGEFVTRDKEDKAVQQFMVFDIYHIPGGNDVSALDFQGTAEAKGRHDHLVDWFSKWTSGEGPSIVPRLGITETNRILLSKKEFIFASPGDSIFDACKRMLSVLVPYHTDGLILTPNKGGLPQNAGVRYNEQLKWKPADQNSIDFLVRFDKDDSGKAVMEPGEKTVYVEETREIVKEQVIHKIARLYVGASLEPAYQDPRGTVLFEQPLPVITDDKRRRHQFKPVLFNPQDPPDTTANTCNLTVELSGSGNDQVVCENGDPIEEDSIVEMRYEPRNEPGWRWIPMRIRYDKTERYQKRIPGSTMNKDEAAEGVWKSIYDPITRHMITTGSTMPSAAEQTEMDGYVTRSEAPGIKKVYYAERSSSKDDLKLVEGLRKFHRVFVKDKLLLGSGLKGGSRSLVDLAVGQGGDMNSWIDGKAEFVLGTDIAGSGIRDSRGGAYNRYLKAVMKYEGFENVPKMIFVIADSGKSLATGEAGTTIEEANMLRAIYGRIAPTGPIPPFAKKYAVGRLNRGADCVACMFAIHYFFENEGRLDGFVQNVSDSLKVGGLFVGCCFDGQKVFDTLADVSEGGVKVGKDGNQDIWQITKKYSRTDFPTNADSLGLPIDVEFISIGTKQTEYLMNFELLKSKMAEIGCELLTADECRVLGVPASTQMFEDTYDYWAKKGEKFAMKPPVKQYSFLNRWFIFKRRRGGVLTTETVAAVTEAQVQVAQTQAQAQTQAETAAVPSPEEGEVPAVPASTTTKPKNAVPKTAAEARALMAAARQKAGPPPLPGTGALQTTAATKEEQDTALKAEAALLAIEAGKNTKAYPVDKVFRFWHDAALLKAKKDDVLGIMDRFPDAGRWVSPFGRFPIVDAKTGVEYPTLEHYIAGMRYQVATNKPELARSIFSSKEGEIHLKHLRDLASATGQGAKALTPEAEQDMAKAERKKVLEESLAFRKYDAVFDESKWLTQKDKILEEGLRQRWDKDDKFRKIVMAAKNKNAYLLYYTGPGTGSELGGHRTARGTIDGENKIGRMMMALAGYTP